MHDRQMTADVVIIGGGLAGLAAAAYAARGGRSVTLCERAPAAGGRAATSAEGEVLFNLGPHALYAGHCAEAVLRELGVSYRGHKPSPSGAFGIARGAKHALPGGLVSLLTTGLFGLPAKLETARLLAGFGRLDPTPLERVSAADWLAGSIRHAEVRALVEALFRVSSYSNDPQRYSAGAAIAQLQHALGKGVLYLDGGWQTLVDGLRNAATSAGARVLTSARAEAVAPDAAGWQVRLADGAVIRSAAVVLAIAPDAAAALLDGAAQATLRQWAAAAIPVKAACLDLALQRLPQPRASFALGIDQPLYLSVHSAVARLAPQGQAVIHVAKYLGPLPADAKAVEAELEGLMDLVQPGWRPLVVARRFLPDMLVTHALPTAAAGGTAGRPGPAVPGVAGLYVAGDWVGADGQLADASLASARQAAALLAAGAGASRAAA